MTSSDRITDRKLLNTFARIEFDDMEDEELKAVLISGVAKTGLAFENIDDIDAVVSFIAQKRRMPGFGNAGINLPPPSHLC